MNDTIKTRLKEIKTIYIVTMLLAFTILAVVLGLKLGFISITWPQLLNVFTDMLADG